MPSVGKILREEISLRSATPEDVPKLTEWLEARKTRNQFDPAILKYPSLEVVACHTNGTTHAFVPTQTVTMLESVGTNPESSSQQVAHSLVLAVKAIEFMAHRSGQRELYFLASDTNTAKGAEHLGFEELDMKVFRKRLGGGTNGESHDAQ
jgi:N-acetylglutamate synthase-like GNAT family acetyltransferase